MEKMIKERIWKYLDTIVIDCMNDPKHFKYYAGLMIFIWPLLFLRMLDLQNDE